MSKESKRKAKRHKGKRPQASSPFYIDPAASYWWDRDYGKAKRPAKPQLSPGQLKSLEEAIRRNIDVEALGLELRCPTTDGVGIYKGDHKVGIVELERAVIGRHLPSGDFTADGGEHWERLAAYLTEAIASEPAIVSAPTIRSGEVLTAFPADIAADVRAQVSAATATIKTGFRDYGIRHVLDAPGYTLTFWQTSKIDGVMGVPFGFAPADGNAVAGVLCILRRDNDPLPILVSSEIDRADVQRAWITAVSDFAKLLTHPEHQPDHAPEDRSAEEAEPRLRAVGTRVAGYKRRLPAGQHASDLQRDRAAAVGVTLAPEGETWVSEYVVNGQDDSGVDAPVRIRWTPAVELDARREPA